MIVVVIGRRGGDGGGDGGGIGHAERPFAVPIGLLGPLVLFVPGAPLGVPLLISLPGLLLGQDLRPTLAPSGGIGGFPLLVDRRIVEGPGAGQVAGGPLRRGPVVRDHPTVRRIDHSQSALGEAVGVFRVPDQERLIGPGVVIVGPLTLGGRLDHPVFASARAPDPRPHAGVVDRIVGWAVGEGGAQGLSPVDVAVALARRRADILNGRRARKRGQGRGGHQRGRVTLGQRQTGDRGAGRGRGRGLVGLLVARGKAEHRHSQEQGDRTLAHSRLSSKLCLVRIRKSQRLG